jgi:N-acetylneuraminic acid mutarotase
LPPFSLQRGTKFSQGTDERQELNAKEDTRMKKQVNPNVQAHLIRGGYYLVMLLAICVIPFALAQRNVSKPEAPTELSRRILTFEERVSYQRAIEEVYWRHRIWPGTNPGPKPPLDNVMSQAAIEKKVEDYLRNSQALEICCQKALTTEELQAELDRMAQHTRQPEMLRELFEALGNDPVVIAECLARPVLAERLVGDLSAQDTTVHCGSTSIAELWSVSTAATFAEGTCTLPKIPDQCVDDTWTPTSTTNPPSARYLHTTVWTGSEMIVWGGEDGNGNLLDTGGKYDPSTDSWRASSTTNAPSARYFHTAVWTGSEMIVWGGTTLSNRLNTGGRYNPTTDSWTTTSTTNAADGRVSHTAVWTGSEMIVWGGANNNSYLNSGGRYKPTTDSWTATSITNAPDLRQGHTAVWTRSEMIVWGGYYGGFLLNTGGRYNPGNDSWTATSTTNAPTGRFFHTALWTGGEMIIWGGTCGRQCGVDYNTGGRYNPVTDNWIPTSTSNAPSARNSHTAVWTGSEMIVWGGEILLNTGGRYTPNADSWTATSTTNAPSGREGHTAVWSGSEMIVWGGGRNTGGRYCAESGPTPTPTPTATATPRASPTARPRLTPSPRP